MLHRTSGRLAVLFSLSIALSILSLLLRAVPPTSGATTAHAASGPRVAAGTFAPEPVSGVIMVDESGSETAAGIRAERDAALALIGSDPSSGSRYMVAGFGSQNRRGEQAVTQYCDFIATDSPAARASLADCIGQIRARTQAQGWDTDHAQAIQFGLDRLQGRTGLRTVFLLTDGRLDVANSPIYGRIPSQRTPTALQLLGQRILPEARAEGVQIWPLGFGPEASYANLEHFAVGGGAVDGRCASSPASRPHAIVVGDFSAVAYSLVSDQTAARCGAVGAINRGVLDPHGALTLRVRIPAIADFGSLTVVTGDPQVRMTFLAPNGIAVPDDGTVDGQTLHRGGIGSDVQTLRIVDPIPGTWTIRLTAPPGLGTQTGIVAFASWEGVLSASLFASPIQAVPGQPVEIQVRVLSHAGILAGGALAGVFANATVTGNFGEIAVPLRLAADGSFDGVAQLPHEAAGEIQVSAVINGPGVAGDRATETLGTQTSDFLTATFTTRTPTTLHPGDVIRGQVTTVNQGPPTQGSLRLGDASPGALVTIDADTIPIPTGIATTPFTLRVSPTMRPRRAFVSVMLARGDTSVSASQVDLEVVAAPSWWTTHRREVIALGFLLLVVVIAVLVWARVRAAEQARLADTGELTATLLLDGLPDGPPIPSDGGDVFALAVSAEDTPRLLHADVSPDGMPVIIRRAGHGVSVRVGEREPQHCRFGEPVVLGDGLAVQIDGGAIEVAPPPQDHVVEPATEDVTNEHAPLAGRWR